MIEAVFVLLEDNGLVEPHRRRPFHGATIRSNTILGFFLLRTDHAINIMQHDVTVGTKEDLSAHIVLSYKLSSEASSLVLPNIGFSLECINGANMLSGLSKEIRTLI